MTSASSRRSPDRFTIGVDSYYKQSHNLIDEGQFGAPIILTPFNYTYGKQYGLELTNSFTASDFTAYLNLAWQYAHGKDIDSAQFNFGADDLASSLRNYIHLDHEQEITASGGVSYVWESHAHQCRLSTCSGCGRPDLAGRQLGSRTAHICRITHRSIWAPITSSTWEMAARSRPDSM